MNLHIISLLVVFNVIPRTVTAPIESRHVEQSNLNITIKLNEPDNQNGQLMLYLNGSSYRLVNVSTLLPIFVHSLSNTRSNLASYFVVIGIHSLDRNITLCNYDSKKPIMNGTNLGLIWKLDNIDHLDPICMYNSAATTIKTLLMFNLYNKYHPIPGGCNIEFPIEESPFMFVHNNPSRALGPLIDYVEFQPAAIGNERSPARRCDEQIGARLNYELYAYYEQTSTIDTNTFNGDSTEHEDDYFHLISLMSNRKWLTRHSTMIYRIGSKQEHEDGSRHSQHHHRDNRHHIAVNDDSSVPSFPRLFIITSLNKRIYFNILTIINHHDKNDDEDALMWINSINMTYADQSKNIKHCSLYVPSQLNTRIFISNHLFLVIIFIVCIAATIYWQALTKLIAQGYGFGCMCTVPRSKISGSSIDTNAVDLQPVSYNREHVAPCSEHVMLQKTSKIRNGSSRKMKRSSINSKKTPNSTRKCNPPSSRKLYRCKHCQKYSTTRSQKRQCNGNGRLHQCQFKSKS
ncbi:hypothetical protein RDWZM_005991 [Blomia tropicalis]|uniref:Uncharacterized protein n=1 Tax=Blomia tropicalis TaxID=40697 RepID=A0A9Q0RMW3_BLOTA|nr:hypothetical protein RDWZM_005991 [Blomia tropicalis]